MHRQRRAQQDGLSQQIDRGCTEKPRLCRLQAADLETPSNFSLPANCISSDAFDHVLGDVNQSMLNTVLQRPTTGVCQERPTLFPADLHRFAALSGGTDAVLMTRQQMHGLKLLLSVVQP